MDLTQPEDGGHFHSPPPHTKHLYLHGNTNGIRCLRLNAHIDDTKAVAGETEGLSPWPRRWSLTALTSVPTKPASKRTPVSVKNVADKANKSWIFSSISKARIFLMVCTMNGEVHATLPHDGVAAVENSVEVPPKIKNGPTL